MSTVWSHSDSTPATTACTYVYHVYQVLLLYPRVLLHQVRIQIQAPVVVLCIPATEKNRHPLANRTPRSGSPNRPQLPRWLRALDQMIPARVRNDQRTLRLFPPAGQLPRRPSSGPRLVGAAVPPTSGQRGVCPRGKARSTLRHLV